MPKIKLINKEQSLIDEYANTKYFCPYSMCRILFSDIYNDHKVQTIKQGYNYQCIHCKRYFNRSTYKDNHKCGKKYQINKTMVKTKDEYLEFHIGNLWNKGYTDREIHTITHFSRQLIGEITKEFRHNVLDICTIEEFDKKYLSDLDNEYKLIPWRDLRTHKIRKAFSMGCSVSQITKILKMGNNTVIDAKLGEYLAEKKKDNFYNRLDPEKEKELIEQESDFLEEVERFLANAEPPLTNKKSNNKNRTRITISTEDKKIRVYGMSDRKK